MKLFKRLLLALIAPLLLLIAAEFILRAADYGYPTAFFIPSEINGRKVLTDNQFFGCRFFSPRITRTPPCIVFDREKAPGTIRVFVLGESAAMGEPLDEFGVARQLAFLLKSRYPGRRFEVINSAMTAINSHVIVEIAREAARFQPDAFVLYIGNNEVVGPYGPGTVFERFTGSILVTRARVLATRLRLAQLLKSVVKLSANKAGGSGDWEGLEMFTERQVPASDLRLGIVRSRFHANIGEILGVARRAGADVVLCTVAVNLRDCPPFSGQDASLLYSNACALEANGEIDAARKTFEIVRDLDRLRVRADSTINGILREIGTSGHPGVHFADVERRFKEISSNGIPGNDYFLDHVHFNFAGNYALASDLAEAMANVPALRDTPAQQTPTLSECTDRLLYTVWDELELTDVTLQRMRRPPFKDQPGNAVRLAALIRHKMDLQDSARSVNLDELRPHYLEAMQADPDDWFYPAGWGRILYDSNLYEESERYLRMALALAPHRYEFRSALGMVLGFMGRAGDGVRAILGQDTKGGLFPSQFMKRTARLLMDKGRSVEALVFLQEAGRQDPWNVSIMHELASCYVKLGQLPEAESSLRDVLKKQPDNAESLEDLAFLLAVTRRWDEAVPLFHEAISRKPSRPEARMKYALSFMIADDDARATQEFQSLLRESPDFAEGHVNLGLLYAKQKQWEPAASQFERAVEIQPDFADAWFQLARVRQSQGRDSDIREPLMNAVRLAPERKDFLEEWNRLFPAPQQRNQPRGARSR